MANALVDHVQSSARRHGKLIPNQFNAEHILNGIHVYKVHDEAALKATVWNLPLWIEKRRKEDTNCLPIKLVLVDSIAFHYRGMQTATIGGMGLISRTQSLSSMASFLQDLAAKYDLAVVLINQMTSKLTGDLTNGSQNKNVVEFVPALGESWAHATTTRLVLEKLGDDGNDERVCRLVKSPTQPVGIAKFQVTEVGIRDITEEAVKRRRIE